MGYQKCFFVFFKTAILVSVTANKLFLPVVLFQEKSTMVQVAPIGKCHKLLQISSVTQFCVQPQEGAVHLHTALQALLSPADCSEKISQEGQVVMKCVSVLSPQHLEVRALVHFIKLGLKVLTDTRLHVREEADDFSGVQLTFTVQVGIGYVRLYCAI